jgi:Ca2+-binding EF-hand superfamily protein
MRDRDELTSELDDGDRRGRGRVGGSSSSDPISFVLDILREKVERARRDGDLTAEDLFRRTLIKHSKPMASADKIAMRDFEKALDFFDARLSAREVAQIFDAVDKDRVGTVDVREIIDFVFPRRSARSSSRERERERDSSSSSLITKGKVTTAFRKRPDLLEEVVSQLNKSGQSVDDLLKIIRRADENKVGFLERNAFAKQLSYFGFHMRTDVERDLVDTIGDGEPGINYEEFCDVVRNEMTRGAQADDVLERLRKRISRDMKQGTDMEEMFERLDRDRNGFIQIDEFERGMEKIGIPISREESKRVIAKFSTSGVSISFRDFVRAFHPSSSGEDVMSDLVTMSLDRIRRSLNSKYGSTSNAGRAIKTAFEQIDADGNGKVDRREIKLAMTDLKIDLTREETDAVFDAMAKGEKSVTYSKFIEFIRGGAFEDLMDSMKRSMLDTFGTEAKSVQRMKMAFEDSSPDSPSLVDRRVLTSVLTDLRVTVTSKDIDIIFGRLDTTNRGKISVSELITLLGFDQGIASDRDRDSDIDVDRDRDRNRDRDRDRDRDRRDRSPERGRDDKESKRSYH